MTEMTDSGWLTVAQTVVMPVTAHYSPRCNFIISRWQSLTRPSRHHNVHKGTEFRFLFFSEKGWAGDAERLLRELLIEATLSWSHRPCGGFVLHYQHRLNQHFNTLGFINPKCWPGTKLYTRAQIAENKRLISIFFNEQISSDPAVRLWSGEADVKDVLRDLAPVLEETGRQIFSNGTITVNLLPVIAAALALGACKFTV